MKIYPESSFFKERRAAALPTPAEIRSRNKKSGSRRATNFNRPSPVIIKELGLFVKYGAKVTFIEARTQMMVRERLQGHVPAPEVFGWTEDGGQGFIYMSLIKGDTLIERWGKMKENERISVCKELHSMAKAWRSLPQEELEGDHFIGSLGKTPLNETYFYKYRPDLAGPFLGANAVQQFQKACGIDIRGQVPILFTHGDLLMPNILVSSGPNPKVAAIVDWGQSGWYPAYWEYCKARRSNLDENYVDWDAQEEWRMKYLPIILDRVDEDTCYEHFLRFVLSIGY